MWRILKGIVLRIQILAKQYLTDMFTSRVFAQTSVNNEEGVLNEVEHFSIRSSYLQEDILVQHVTSKHNGEVRNKDNHRVVEPPPPLVTHWRKFHLTTYFGDCVNPKTMEALPNTNLTHLKKPLKMSALHIEPWVKKRMLLWRINHGMWRKFRRSKWQLGETGW